MNVRIALILGLALGLSAHRALAGPSDVSRVLRTIDFEERALGNHEDLPMHWSKITGPGLPHYVNGLLSKDKSRSGSWCFRFDLDGGSLIYRYDERQIPVRVGAHYRVEVYVKTTPLPHARARLSAYFTDMDGHPIAATVQHSELYAASSEDDDWHRLELELTAPANGQFLAIELGLIQPSLYEPPTLGERTLFDQDINGTAWFDDVTVSQVPELTLSTGQPGNIFGRSQPLRLAVLVNDRFTDDLAAQLLIRDAVGNAVYQRSGALDSASAQDMGLGQKQVVLHLPDLPPGWYDAKLTMTSSSQFVGEKDLHLIRLADDNPPSRPDSRFGVIATDLPFAGWAQLPDILPILAVGRVKLAVWNEAGNIQQEDALAFDSLLERLAKLGITPTACLTALPPTVAENVGGSDWSLLLKSPREKWRPELAYLIARHANHLDRWQFGADKDAAEFVEKPEMRQVYDLLYREFSQLVDKPDLAMPWPAWYDLPARIPATVALSVPPEVLPSQLPLYIEDIRGHEGHNLSLSLQLLDVRYGRLVQIRDLAQRVTYALAGGASRIDLPLPFVVRNEGGHLTDEPLETFMMMRTLITQLGGATYEGMLPAGDDVEAFLFDRDGVGVVVLWNRSNSSGSKKLALNLGRQPMIVDLWGNATPVVQNQDENNDTVSVDVGPMPFFLVDVDDAVAQLRASVRIDKPLLESSFEAHWRHVRFTNPSHTTIGGMLKLVGPKGWTITPAVFNFSLNPGETFDREISIEFPYNSFAGPKTIDANFSVQSARDTKFSVPITVSLGLSDVGIQTLAFRDNDALMVQQMITNYGEKPVNYAAFALYPGQPRQERLVMDLGPGRTTIKLYRFNHVQIIPRAKVRSGVRELQGTRILNDEVDVQ